MDLETEFGGIDIYLFDQLLRGRITPRDRVFDAGCGWGRNLVYLLRSGCEVHAVDPGRRRHPRRARARRAPGTRSPSREFSVPSRLNQHRCGIGRPPSSSVARCCISRATRPSSMPCSRVAGACSPPRGMFFCRLATSIGIESRIVPLQAGGRRCRLPGMYHAVPHGRGAAHGADAPTWRTTPRSPQDYRRPGSARDDDLGGAQERLSELIAGRRPKAARPLLRIALRMMAMAPQVGHLGRLLAVLATEFAEAAAFGHKAFAGSRERTSRPGSSGPPGPPSCSRSPRWPAANIVARWGDRPVYAALRYLVFSRVVGGAAVQPPPHAWPSSTLSLQDCGILR